MSVWDKYECEGQLSLFDFLESPKQENNVDRQRKIELEVVDMILNWTIANCRGWPRLPREERIQKAKECNSNSAGARQGYLWKCDANGIDITFDEPIGKCSAVHIGWPMFDNRVFGKESKAERIEVNVRGLLDDGYCPVCNLQLDDLAEQCPECGTLLSWNDWRRINAEYIESR